MDFNAQNYPTIKIACRERHDIEFIVPVQATGYYGSTVAVPDTWQTSPPSSVLPEDSAYLLAHISSDVRGTVTALEIRVHLDGGVIHYKSAGEDKVAMRVTWPATA
jgi:hypothetical protein